MPHYQWREQQVVHASIEAVWDFISAPNNLKMITPPQMGFEITSGQDISRMYEGMIISYKVRPLLGITTTWVTEITHVKKHAFFVDEQRVGPYKMWHHQHHISPHEQGTLMTDIVTYQPPLGWIGALANATFIKEQLRQIFNFRREAIHNIFTNDLK